MAFSFRVCTNWCHDFPKLARESGFYFNMHRSKVRIDWTRICNIDIDRVIKERDFCVVDENVNNVIDYSLESEYDVKILDPNFVKLFRLAQLAVEYLLYCKQYLDHSVVILKDELRLKIEENVKLKTELNTAEEVIKHLKEKSKEKEKLIEARIVDCNGEIFKCPHCPKTFISSMFVNAHIARRHAYVSNMCMTSSPIHEHYRNETEKLHNEIKDLKERLNQTERVIRKESDRIPEKARIDYNMKLAENETESFRCNANMSAAQEYKGYQEEINNLKTMLFDELRNLKQREQNVQEHVSEINVKTLISQQEKEFQKLKSQLLERLTPDIQSMNAKLHSQENFWKSKIEYLESQHHEDVEKLITELKLTQKTADQIKAEYESKVNDLERQTANQSNMLLEQSKQLHSLSREINQSQNGGLKNCENNVSTNSDQFLTVQQNGKSYKNADKTNLKQDDRKDLKMDRMIVEDIDSASSIELTDKVIPLVSQTKSIPRNIHTLKNKITTPKNVEHTKEEITKQLKSSTRIFENMRDIEKKLKSYASTDMSDSQDSLPVKQNNYQIKRPRYNLDDRLSTKDPHEKSNSRITVKNHKHIDVSENDVTSESISETDKSDSESISDSESVVTVQNNCRGPKEKASPPPLSKLTNIRRNSKAYKKLQMSLRNLFDKKLRDLGIDPDWQGIPKMTFKQKMELVKHHQNIAAKKILKYHEIKSKIIQEVIGNLSKDNQEVEGPKSAKNVSSNKLVPTLKAKTVKAFSRHKNSDDDIFLSKSQDTTLKELYSKPKNDYSFKNIKETGETKNVVEPSVLSRNKDILNLYDHLESSPKAIESQTKISSRLSKSSESIRQMMNSYDPSPKNSYDYSSKVRPLFEMDFDRPIQHKVTLTPTKSEPFIMNRIETDDLSTPKMQQDFAIPSKHNKSVLKSASGSSGSLVKKKVIFDLKNNEDEKSLPDYYEKKEELNDSDWNASSLSDEEQHEQITEHKNTSNIILRTAQSDKIAQISRKLEAQLRIVRQKPAGSIETIFASEYVQDRENQNAVNQKGDSTGVTSALESPHQTSTTNLKQSNDLYPQPAPRNIKENLTDFNNARSLSEESDLDSDIDKLLKIE